MRRILALAVCVFATTSFAAEPSKPNYYPLAKGAKWEYRLSADERECELVCEIVESETKNGKTQARMEGRLPNSVTLGEEVSADVKGVYRNAVLGAKLVQPQTIIKYPVKVRDEWKEKIQVGDCDGTVVIKIKDTAASIQVPAGKFTTMAVESVTEMKGERVVANIWYADGIGIVKQETTAGTRVLTLELKKFSPPK
jgi:hypothetical protein